MLRLCGAELVEVPAVPYANPNNYVKVSGRLAARARAERAERRDLGQPVRQRRQPRRPHRDHRPGDLGADRAARSTASSARSAPAARWPASASRSRSATRTSRSASPIRSARRSTATTRTGELKAEGTSITEGIGQGRITTNLEGAPVDIAYQIPGRGGAADRLRSARARRAVPRRLVRHQRRRRDPPGARARARPHHRHRAVRLRHALPDASCSIRSSCARRTCRCRAGWSAARRSRCRSRRCDGGALSPPSSAAGIHGRAA